MKFDTPEWRDERDRLLLEWMLGTTEAVDFLVTLFHIAEVWDDLIDKDKPVSDDQINEAFVMSLFDLGENPFYARHGAFLRPVMVLGVNAWLDSVNYERHADPHWLTWAFVLRNWYMELVSACAFVVGGFAHMRKVSMEARQFFQSETLEQYMALLYQGE